MNMGNQIFDRDERDPSREPDPLPKGTHIIGTADARALWSVRVLDAWADAKSCDPFKTARLGGEWHCTSAYGPKTLGIGQRFIGSTPDAARLAAALAVYPTLPADVRAKLGVRP